MATPAQTRPQPAKGELERQRRRQLREDQVRDRRIREEQAIAASAEEAPPVEMSQPQIEEVSESEPEPAKQRQRQTEQTGRFNPFTEEMAETEDQSEKKAAQPTQPTGQQRDSVSDRIRQLRQARGSAQAVSKAQQGATSIRESVQIAKAAQNLGATATRAGARAAVQGVVAFLNIPIGPLPLWAWLLILLGVIMLLAAVWVGLAVLAAAACEDQRVAWLPDIVKSAFAQLVVGLPCPTGGT